MNNGKKSSLPLLDEEGKECSKDQGTKSSGIKLLRSLKLVLFIEDLHLKR